MDLTSSTTLANNSIALFIIRIDISQEAEIDFVALANALSFRFYERIEKVLHRNINVDVESLKNDVQETYNYVLKQGSDYQLRISTFDRSIIFETNKYLNKGTYMQAMINLVSVLEEQSAVEAVRIGMRYINTFACSKIQQINKIFKTNIARTLKDVAGKESVSRIINIEEYNYDTHRLKVQYGVVNKFYPAIISNYDLTLDIDVFSNEVIPIGDWINKITEYNHIAYDEFVDMMNVGYLDKLR